MSIDYGTEWFKVGLIKPGMPLDVALNKDSKRKTQSVVTFRNNERIYGSDAISLAGRFPHLTYTNLKSILAKSFDDPLVQEYRERHVNKMIVDEKRNAPVFAHSESNQLSVEELIAYQFQNAKRQASETAGENVKDVVITITPFANQYERQAILDAAELAGLNVLSLMHDETAVALNFAVNQELSKEPESHLFYDMGAGSTVASIVTFSEIQDTKTKRYTPQLEVKSVGFDRTLGGHEFDTRLQQLLVEGFMKLHAGKVKEDIKTSNGAMIRLLKEANRVKQILSANTETFASIEGLHEGLDFKWKVSRAELESITQDLVARVNLPLQAALDAANMTIDDIKSVILVGGGVRVPAIQNQLNDFVGREKIAKNVNGDEAAVLGAAFRGASLSNQFRLSKQMNIKDITVFPIEVTYQPQNKNEDVTTTLYDTFANIGNRNIMSFDRNTDFEFEVNYGKDIKTDMRGIAKVKVNGLTAAFKKHQDDIKNSEQPPKVRVIFSLSDSGILSVAEASLTVGKPTLKEKVKSFFGGKDNTENKEESKEGEKKSNETEPSTNKTSTEETSKKSVNKIPLEVEFIPLEKISLSAQEKEIAKKRIKDLDFMETQKRLREEARNSLESFVYRVQDFLYDDVVQIVTKEEDIEKFREKLSETSEWLYDEGENSETHIYNTKLRELQSIEGPIQHRFKEYKERPKNIELIASIVESVKEFANNIRGQAEDVRYHTEEELEALSSTSKAVEEWIDEQITKQKAILDTDEPILLTSKVLEKAKHLKSELLKLVSKKKPKVVKKEPTPPQEEEPSEATEKSAEEPAATQSQEHDEL
ncbi:heat shock protein 70 family [Sporodiniella umbellata]|nr:heat shock protein 70 family [Sporodiniella umbellata]